jgi:hypothetical protein
MMSAEDLKRGPQTMDQSVTGLFNLVMNGQFSNAPARLGS